MPTAPDALAAMGRDEARAAAIIAAAYRRVANNTQRAFETWTDAVAGGDSLALVRARSQLLTTMAAALAAEEPTIVAAITRTATRAAEHGAAFATAMGGTEAAGATTPAAAVEQVRATAADTVRHLGAITERETTVRARFDVDALNIGRNRDMVTVRERQMATARETAFNAYGGDLEWQWVAQLDNRTCGVCWGLHGSIHSGPMDRAHTRCRCMPCPVDDTRRRGVDRFAELSEQSQVTILGPAKAAAYRDGRFPLDDLIGVNRQGQFRERPLTYLVGPADARTYISAAMRRT